MGKKLQTVKKSWSEFQIVRSEKVRFESSLRATLGYGGMIHHFKNYVLRKKYIHLEKTRELLGGAQTILDQYSSLGVSRAEKNAIEDIERVVNQYGKVLLLANQAVDAKRSSKEIDILAKVDDTAAIRGFQTLRSEMISANDASDVFSRNKGLLISDLRASLGYGAMIHSFKNYVLRHDDKYLKKTNEYLRNALSIIIDYKTLGSNRSENVALDDISKTISEYSKTLETVRLSIRNKDSIENIDKKVFVDDALALRGLRTLDREVSLRIDLQAVAISDSLKKISALGKVTTIGVSLLILSIVILLLFLIQYSFINPIAGITETMNYLANGQYDKEVPGTNLKNEMGMMARAVQIFKENSIKRKDAEEKMKSAQKKLEEANKKLQRLSSMDSLTGIANRRYFDDFLDREWRRSARDRTPLSLILMDIDFFKKYNDGYGHQAGDDCLKKVAKKLNEIVNRPGDLVARYGGEEFVIVLGNTDLKTATALAEKLRSDVEDMQIAHKYRDGGSVITASIGVSSTISNTDSSLAHLIGASDKALYKAKEEGRNRVKTSFGVLADGANKVQHEQ
tara:strand:- start:3444 stop:5144 length:1701 start_codon:yes stop_codon:yes gene_type:complete